LLVRRLAVQKIEAAGLKAQVVTQPETDTPKGEVKEQNPGPGSKSFKGSTVTLTVSSGYPMVPVPDVRTQEATTAVQTLTAAGLVPKVVYIYSSAQSNTVTGQNPAAKKIVRKGSTVRINVSKGLKPVGVPDVTGQPYANAASALQGQGFSVARQDINNSAPKGQVVAENPPAGTSVPKGSKIILSVSKGPATSQVPDVRGQAQGTAEQLVQGAGYTVALIFVDVNDPSQDGTVIDQDPAPGTNAPQGAVVTLTVGQLGQGQPGETTTPETTTTAPPPTTPTP
jgi:serine/threonine-protein kinase